MPSFTISSFGVCGARSRAMSSHSGADFEAGRVHGRNQEERRLTHEEIMGKLPPPLPNGRLSSAEGGQGEWWVGQSPYGLKSIYDGNAFMNEAHVHGFANRLNRTIMTLDVRSDFLAIYELSLIHI